MIHTRHIAIALVTTAVAAAFAAAPAGATTVCVPAFTATCPDNGSNLQQSNLQVALQIDVNDGEADKVVLAPGTYASSGYQTPGKDPLEIVGAGADATTISASSDVDYVLRLQSGSRPVTVRNLTVDVPALVKDNNGTAVAMDAGDVLDGVALRSENQLSDGVASKGGGEIRNSSIAAAGGGSLSNGVRTDVGKTGTVVVDRVTIEGASGGIRTVEGNTAVVRRSRIVDPGTFGILVGDAYGYITNSVIVAGAGEPVDVVSGTGAPASASLTHVTIVHDTADDVPAVTAFAPYDAKAATLTVFDSVLRGFATTYRREALGGTTGGASVTLTSSDFGASGTSKGPGNVDLGAGNIDADPMFAGPRDFHLLPGSPAIDRARPGNAGITTDFDLNPRTVDGDGDGTARRDMGAFEYQPPGSDPQGPAGGGSGGSGDPGSPGQPQKDTTAPTVGNLKWVRALTARKGGALRLTLSEAAKVQLTFKPAGKPKGKTVQLTFAGKQGPVTLKIKGKVLRARRYKLAVVATDAAGNRSKTTTRKVTVR